MLIGREALRQGYVVDPARSFVGGRAPREARRRNRGKDDPSAGSGTQNLPI